MNYRHRVKDTGSKYHGLRGNSVRRLPGGRVLFALEGGERIEISESSLEVLKCDFTRPEYYQPQLPTGYMPGASSTRDWDAG